MHCHTRMTLRTVWGDPSSSLIVSVSIIVLIHTVLFHSILVRCLSIIPTNWLSTDLFSFQIYIICRKIYPWISVEYSICSCQYCINDWKRFRDFGISVMYSICSCQYCINHWKRFRDFGMSVMYSICSCLYCINHWKSFWDFWNNYHV